jgi:hypothetical protein
LEKVDGIVDIETNTGDRTCSFKVTNPDLDYEAKLSELAETNEHLAEFEMM